MNTNKTRQSGSSCLATALQDASRLLVAVLVLIGGRHANGQLTASVQPGYVFAPGERPTTATLNQLGQPTISIAGTVSGTVGLAAGTVTGTHLANSVPDGVTIQFNTASPRQLQIVPAVGGSGGGVSETNISSAALGAGLAGGSGTKLTVTNLVANELRLTTNTIVAGVVSGLNQTVPGSEVRIGAGLGIVSGALVVTNASVLVTNGGPGSAVTFTTNVPVSSGTTLVAHGLPGTPQQARWVLVCTNADLGYLVGDEIDVWGLVDSSDTTAQTAQTGANAGGCFVQLGVAAPKIRRASDLAYSSITPSKWNLRCRATYFP